MTFEVSADAYDRMMGRYSVRLSSAFADFAEVADGQRALDVGCGPGALTAELVARLGAERVVGADPSPPFVAAARARLPGVEIVEAGAEALPFEDDAFDVTLAQLVLAFASDPDAALTELRRVTRPGGVVAVSMWDLEHERAPHSPIWRAARALDRDAPDERGFVGAREGDLARRLAAAGLDDVDDTGLEIEVEHAGFDDWWSPFTSGVGPVGAYVAALDEDARAAVRERCRQELGDGPVRVAARAWAARGRA